MSHKSLFTDTFAFFVAIFYSQKGQNYEFILVFFVFLWLFNKTFKCLSLQSTFYFAKGERNG